MAERAAIVTGASSGIGLAIAHVLGEEGYGVTIVARRRERLDAAAAELGNRGFAVLAVAGDVASEETVKSAVAQHRARFGRLDVLVNNAGVGLPQVVEELNARMIEKQLGVNLRSMMFFYREAMPLLRQAGEEHRNALVVNMSSISGIAGEALLSVYSATKHAIIGWTQSMNQELGGAGVKSTALCPAFVDTAMTEFARGRIAREQMITTADIAESIRYMLKLSPGCVIPEIRFLQPAIPPR